MSGHCETGNQFAFRRSLESQDDICFRDTFFEQHFGKHQIGAVVLEPHLAVGSDIDMEKTAVGTFIAFPTVEIDQIYGLVRLFCPLRLPIPLPSQK